jgi:hypothetical protein
MLKKYELLVMIFVKKYLTCPFHQLLMTSEFNPFRKFFYYEKKLFLSIFKNESLCFNPFYVGFAKRN